MLAARRTFASQRADLGLAHFPITLESQLLPSCECLTRGTDFTGGELRHRVLVSSRTYQKPDRAKPGQQAEDYIEDNRKC